MDSIQQHNYGMHVHLYGTSKSKLYFQGMLYTCRNYKAMNFVVPYYIRTYWCSIIDLAHFFNFNFPSNVLVWFLIGSLVCHAEMNPR